MNIILKLFSAIAFIFFIAFVLYLFLHDQNALAQEPEIKTILSSDEPSVQATAYRALIERLGPQEAQELLLTSGIPFNGESHIINHEVGNYLYETKGPGGLVYCKDYFLGSCFHGVILNSIADLGLEGITVAMDECYARGTAATAACAHAVGHGLLAWTGYTLLPQAAAHCERFGEENPNFPTFNCLDGVFMENVWGVHDGAPSPDRWVRENDPHFPCTDSEIEGSWRPACWSNQITTMMEQFDGDIARVGTECRAIENDRERWVCFDGLARQIHAIVGNETRGALALCNRLQSQEVPACVSSIAAADIASGGVTLSYELCNELRPSEKTLCYNSITQSILFTFEATPERRVACNLISETNYRAQCHMITQSLE